MKTKVKKCLIIFISIIILIIAIINCIIIPPQNAKKRFKCDYQALSLTTEIKTINKNDEPVIIKGKKSILTNWYEDPLVMISESDGEVLALADDSYNLITENDHSICSYQLIGEFSIFGIKYTVKDTTDTVIGYINFNMLNTTGIFTDTNGVVLAQFDSALFRYDYVVSVFEANTIDEDILQMIFASCASDRKTVMSSNN